MRIVHVFVHVKADAVEVFKTVTLDKVADGVAWVRELCADLAIPSLATFGVTQAEIPEVVAKAQKASSMQGNPIVLTVEELTQILQQAI